MIAPVNRTTKDWWALLWADPENEDALASLVQVYTPMVDELFRSLREVTPHHKQDDIRQEGFIGLVVALRRYLPEMDKGSSGFRAFAFWQIRGRMIQCNKDTSWLKRGTIDVLSRLGKYSRAFHSENGRDPTLQEQSDYLLDKFAAQYSVKSIEAIYDRAKGRKSLDQPIFEGQETLHSVVADKRGSSPYENIEWDDIHEALRSLIKDLPERDRTIIEMYYWQDASMADIDKALGCAPNYASSLHGNVLRELKAVLEMNGHSDLFDDHYVHEQGIRLKSGDGDYHQWEAVSRAGGKYKYLGRFPTRGRAIRERDRYNELYHKVVDAMEKTEKK